MNSSVPFPSAVTDPSAFTAARAAFEDDCNQLNLVRAVLGTVAFGCVVAALVVLRPRTTPGAPVLQSE